VPQPAPIQIELENDDCCVNVFINYVLHKSCFVTPMFTKLEFTLTLQPTSVSIIITEHD